MGRRGMRMEGKSNKMVRKRKGDGKEREII